MLGGEAQPLLGTRTGQRGRGLALRLVAPGAQRLHLARQARHIGLARLDRGAVGAHLLVERQRLGPQAREVGARGGELGGHRTGLALDLAAAALGLGQAAAGLRQVARDARGIAAGRLGPGQRLAQLPLERRHALLVAAARKADIGEARRHAVTLGAQAVALGQHAVALLAQRRGGTLRGITRRGGGGGIVSRARQAAAQLLRLAPLQRQHLRQLRHLAVQPVERPVARTHRDRQEPLRQHEDQQHEDDDHEQRGQRIHIAGPGIQPTPPPPPLGRPRHGGSGGRGREAGGLCPPGPSRRGHTCPRTRGDRMAGLGEGHGAPVASAALTSPSPRPAIK
ncbi:MAG: hypothetical protein MUC64_19150 [Rubritepida sp.]|nr:hypothetical protein [Rubritepida sp.]